MKVFRSNGPSFLNVNTVGRTYRTLNVFLNSIVFYFILFCLYFDLLDSLVSFYKV